MTSVLSGPAVGVLLPDEHRLVPGAYVPVRGGIAPQPFGPARPPRVGIINLMPHAEQFEQWLLPQFAAALPFEPVFIRMGARRYALDDPSRIDRLYRPYADAVGAAPLDGLIVTGAAVEDRPYSEVRFLPELTEIIARTAQAGTPILGLCWGGMAVGHLLLGLPKREYRQKVFGMFETELMVDTSVEENVIVSGLDDQFWTAHSRFAGFDEEAMDARAAENRVRVLARAAGAGTVIAESPDHKVVMHIGHPEYSSTRLADEYRRDLAKGDDIAPPAGVDLDRPARRWQSHSLVFFANWMKLVYQGVYAR